MAKKVKEVAQAAPVEVKEVAQVEATLIDKKAVVVIIGEEKGSLATGKEFTVSGDVANVLIAKGYAKLKTI
jgi:hypothetical protein